MFSMHNPRALVTTPGLLATVLGQVLLGLARPVYSLHLESEAGSATLTMRILGQEEWSPNGILHRKKKMGPLF